jgi:hypothetical protein
MTFIRKIKRGSNVYYQEVENVWVNGKTVQKHIRYVGKDKDRPSDIPLERVQFGFIATRLMQGDLSPSELLDMIEKMGNLVDRENLERIGLYYNFKKNSFSLSLYRKRLPKKQKDAERATGD